MLSLTPGLRDVLRNRRRPAWIVDSNGMEPATMKALVPLLALPLALALGACRAHPLSTTGSPASTGSMPAHPAASQAAVESALHAGMAYGSFRKAMLDHGWRPLPDARCLANVVGGNAATLCTTHPQLASCRACTEVPELSACSGDGHCQMQFQHGDAHEVLRANTFGPLRDWNAPADQSQLRITSWQIAPARTAPAGTHDPVQR